MSSGPRPSFQDSPASASSEEVEPVRAKYTQGVIEEYARNRLSCDNVASVIVHRPISPRTVYGQRTA